MLPVREYYIGPLKLEIIDDPHIVGVSFVEAPPHLNKLKDLPEWTFSSQNAIWFLQENQTIATRAKHRDAIKKDLALSFVH